MADCSSGGGTQLSLILMSVSREGALSSNLKQSDETGVISSLLEVMFSLKENFKGTFGSLFCVK